MILLEGRKLYHPPALANLSGGSRLTLGTTSGKSLILPDLDMEYISPSKLQATAGIDDRVHGGVNPAKPSKDSKGNLRVVDTGGTDTSYDIGHKER